MNRQCTLKTSISVAGVGLHSGKKVYMTLRPAPESTGIVFRRVDTDPVVEIRAKATNVSDTVMSTNLEKRKVRVCTVEHLMSAIYGMGIDNLYVDLTAEEVPIMDGSAAPFIFLIEAAGIQTQTMLRKYLRIKKPIAVRVEDKSATLKPYDGFKLGFKIEFDHPAFAEKYLESSLEFSQENFIREISRARTFGFMKDIEYLRSHNLARGGSFENAIVVDDTRVLNREGLRYENEFVKHKMLDAFGDLFLAGHRIIGEYYGYKSGHQLNNMLLRRLFDAPESFEYVTFEEISEQRSSEQVAVASSF